MIRMVRRLMRFSRGYTLRIRLAYVFSFLKAMGSNVPLFLSIGLLGLLLKKELTLDKLLVLTLALFTCFGLTTLFQNIADRLQSTAGYELFAAKREEFARHLRSLPMGYFTSGNLGRISSILSSDMVFIEENAMNILADVASDLFSQGILLVFLFTLHPALGLTGLATVLCAVLLSRPMNQKSAQDSITRQASIETLTDAILEYTEGLAVAKSFGQTRESATRLRGGFHQMTEANLGLEEGRTPYERTLQLIYGAGTTLILALAVLLYEKGSLPLGSLIGVLLFLFHLFSPIRHLYQQNMRFTIMETALDRYEEVLSQKPLPDQGKAILPAPGKAGEEAEIAFEHVSFGYGDELVLKDISFTVQRGQVVALVGPSGSGKTTVASLLSRFWDVREGRITLRGVDVRDIPLQTLMGQISMVFQKVYLFEDTVAANIAMGRRDATQEEIREAARLACCLDFIEKLPYGFASVLSEGGSSLSGGERERLSIARCFLKNAPIIVLDEATASLDAQNEAAIHEAMTGLCRGKTTLVIAHRLHTIRNADKILVLDKGTLAESGTHEELLAQGGVYARLWALQEESEKEVSL